KINKATELRKKTIPRAMDMVLGSALIIGDTAAMALPPQMVVPEVIKWLNFLSNCMYFPTSKPKTTVKKIERVVKLSPSKLVSRVSIKDIPKPKPTTAIFNKY